MRTSTITLMIMLTFAVLTAALYLFMGMQGVIVAGYIAGACAFLTVIYGVIHTAVATVRNLGARMF